MSQDRGKEQQELPVQVIEQAPAQTQRAPIGAVAVSALAYILCLLISITPLQRLAGTIHFAQVKTNRLLTVWGSWLPVDLHMAKDSITSRHSTSVLELILLVALMFVIYGLCALLLRHQPANGKNTVILGLIVLAVIPMGLIFVLAPALISQDIFTYADYGLMIAAYHANPYFVTPTAHPENPLIAFDIWRSSTAASGPVWLVVCTFVAKVATAHPLRYILAFRLLGLAIHVMNIVLVAAILRKLGLSARVAAVGTLLYAWNPLILMAACLNGHNDALVLTFLLLGILLGIQAEQNDFLLPNSYLPPLIAFTLAALVQPLVAPIVVLFLILLACKAFSPTISDFSGTPPPAPRRMPLAITLSGILVSGLVVLALYGPFWLGHSVQEIIASFRSVPPAQLAQGSILAAIQQWNAAYSRPTGIVAVLSQRGVWDVLSGVVIISGLLIGGFFLWRAPTMRTLVLIALATLSAVLIITPWFQLSYLVWLVGLAVVLLPVTYKRLSWALMAFSLAASISALLVYLFNGYQPSGSWIILTPLLIFGPPVLAFLLAFFLKDTFFLAELWNGRLDEGIPLPVKDVDLEGRKKRV
jgi:hypothetical protein